uniref:deoxyribose-phosphate aldolase isoform X3 n=1 Tax=Scatophagus argus TaxID=75038 RepID=UPI001ED803B5|nr:deoxyribose-phosphate aldolase isoform X3 [Scatophagus argus]
MSARNPGTKLDLEWISKVRVNRQAVLKRAQRIQGLKMPTKQWQAAWLLKAITCIDLTTLGGDDTSSNVHRLCLKAIHPVRRDLLRKMDMDNKGVTTAAVCVYPSRVADAVISLKAANSSLPIASAMYHEICQFREACGDAHMKTILAVGELGTFTNVYKASLVAMMAGSDFIKTSTGKEAVNATYAVAIVMVRAIRDYFLCTGYKVGFKPAGGIRTAQESLLWLTLVKEELGSDWLCPPLFRLGASSLLADIERSTITLLDNMQLIMSCLWPEAVDILF